MPSSTASVAPSTSRAPGRYAQQWLEHQAVAGILTVDDTTRPAADRRYTLPEAHAIALLDEEHPAYVGALADIPAIIGRTLTAVESAFRPALRAADAAPNDETREEGPGPQVLTEAGSIPKHRASRQGRPARDVAGAGRAPDLGPTRSPGPGP